MDDFVYYRRKTLQSFLWATWLRFPRRFRCLLYRFLLAVFARASSNSPDLKKLPFGLYAKVGREADGESIAQEALSLQFVADYTSIPVPEVLDLLQDDVSGSVTTIMLISRVPGTPVSRLHTSLATLTEEQQTKLADTLRDWLNQLQYLRSPYGRTLCGYLGSSFTSYRINSRSPIGPYRSQNHLHDNEPCCAMTPSHDPKVRSLAAIIRQKRYDISFVHGNVCPENVLVDEKTGVPTGLVGWECAAWMPSYWELTSGSWSVRGRMGVESVWTHVLVRCLPQYMDELRVDKELWRTYTPY